MSVRLACVLAVLPTAAHAQVAAARADEPPHVGLGVKLAVGEAVANGLDNAWVARLEYDLLPVLAPPDGRPGPLTGFTMGAEYWRAGHGTWGIALPVQLVLGVRAAHVRVTGGLGADVLLVDQVHGDTGVGFYAPLACLSAGLDIHSVTVLADVRVTRRWQIGADDFTQWMFTLSVGYTKEGPPPKGGIK
ncbi:MAG: hypothetical protein ABI704_30070 [Kofleriaceae bacterium]